MSDMLGRFATTHVDAAAWPVRLPEPAPAPTATDDTPAALIAALREYTEALRAARESPAPSPPQETRTPAGDRLRAAAWAAISVTRDFHLDTDDDEYTALVAAAEAYDALPVAPPRTTVEEFCSTAEGRALFEQEAAILDASEAVYARVSNLRDEIAERWGEPKEDVLLKALTLYRAALEAEDAGHHMAILSSDDEIIRDVTEVKPGRSPDPSRVTVDRAALEELREAARSVADPREVSQGDARAACKRLVIAIAAFDDPKAQKHHPAIAGNRLTPEAIEAGRRGVAGAYKFADDSRRDADRE